jgi:hypothetical protein
VEKVFTIIVVLAHEVILHTFSALTQYVVVTVGLREGEVPEIINDPPHEPEYQFQLAPVPKLPPKVLKIELLPRQILAGEDDADVGEDDEVFTVIIVLTQFVVLQIFSALNQYVVVTVGLRTGFVPDIEYVPPQETVYQFQLAPVPILPPIIFNVEELPLQIIEGLEYPEVGDDELVCTEIVTLIHEVVLHEPCALIQYVVVIAGLKAGEDPDFKNVPAQDPENQFQLASVPNVPPVILSVEELPMHITEGVEEIVLGLEENVFTVIFVLRHEVVLHKPSALAQ